MEPHALDRLHALPDGHFERLARLRVRSNTEPRTSPMTEAISPGSSSWIGFGLQPVFVAEGKVVEQVFDSVNAARGKVGGDTLADSLDVLGRGWRAPERTATPMVSPEWEQKQILRYREE